MHHFHFTFSRLISKPRFSLLHHSFSSNSTSHPTKFVNLLQGHIPHHHLLQIHTQIFRFGAHQDNLVATRLIGHYPSQFALRVFSLLCSPNLFPFNAIIRVLAEEGLCSPAFSVFRKLNSSLLSPNDLTFSFLLKACLQAKDDCYVKKVHTHVLKLGYVENSFVCNGLLVVYGRGFRDMVSARKVFDDMPDKGVVGCWTSLISGFAKLGDSVEVLNLFLSMLDQNLQPDDDTMVSVLSACSNLEILQVDKWVKILSDLLYKIDSKNLCRDSVSNVLVYLYGKKINVEKSRECFDGISDDGKRSVLPWNAIIGVYVQNGFAMEALGLFRLMMEVHKCKPNHVTMVSVLSACAQIGDLDFGMWVHENLKFRGRKGIISSNKNIATSLIDMYMKCGSLQRARNVFMGMVTKDVISYNAMILGLAMNGEEDDALRLFTEMQKVGLNPNGGTFLGALCACCHGGFIDKGYKIFADMNIKFSINPNLEHYACYIDLLSRVGNLEEAIKVAKSMPFKPNSFVLGSLLSGCHLHNKLELAKDVSKSLVSIDPENSAGYVMMSNAFANDFKWDDVLGMRLMMRENGVRKQPGCSWISINGVVHEFLAGSPSHPQLLWRISNTLDTMLKEMKLGK